MKRNAIVVAVVATLVLSACGSDKKSTTTTVKGKAGGAAVVHTSAPLVGLVATLVTAFNKANPTTKLGNPPTVETVAVMAAAIATGKPGIYVLATSSIKKLGGTATKGALGHDQVVIAVPAANPHHVTGLASFAPTSGLRVTACGKLTAFGNLPSLVLIKARIKPSHSILTHTCGKELQDLVSGKLDAALVARGSLTVPKGVKLISVPAAQNLVIDYSYVLAGPSPKVAAFGKFIASPSAKAILTLRGYLP